MKIKDHTIDFTLFNEDWEQMTVNVDQRRIEISYQDQLEGPPSRIYLSHLDFDRVVKAVDGARAAQTEAYKLAEKLKVS